MALSETNGKGRHWSALFIRYGVPILKTLVTIAVTMLGLLLVTFVIGRVMPIDPVLSIVGESASKATYDAARESMGLDKPVIVQFFYYLWDVLHGDFGMSLLNSRPVSEDIRRVFPATLELATLGTIMGIVLGVPLGVVALAFVAALGAGIENAVLAISLTAWPPYARIARAETLTIRGSDYIAAVKLQGAGPLRIITKHIWPMCISSLIVRVTLDMAGVILAAAGLGFLGLGAQPPSPEWGAMISEGRKFILDHWWVATMPGLAIFTVSLAFNLLGDGLRDVLDPKEGSG